MSTGAECAFVEVAPNVWYYMLEGYDAPKWCDDWREYASLYGPFTTLESGLEHLDNNHANPGGFTSRKYQPGAEERYAKDPVFQKLLKELHARPATRRFRW